jgi:hypothetical protein
VRNPHFVGGTPLQIDPSLMTIPYASRRSKILNISKGDSIMKKKIDEYQIYEKHYEQILTQVKNDPYAQSLDINQI